jgi:glycosyltransferase involved in cell wall biosynthesis
VRLSVVVPTFRSSGHITKTLEQVTIACKPFYSLEIVVVDDGSEDLSFDTALKGLQGIHGIAFQAIQLSKNMGQSTATAIGLFHSRGDWVVTLDDDLSFPPTEIPKLLSQATENLDFIVGAPNTYSNSTPRRAASLVVRWLGVRLLGTPKHFVFSSLVAYRRDFLQRIEIPSQRVDEIGWMFLLTNRYQNAHIEVSEQPRSATRYSLKSLYRMASPLSQLFLRSVLKVAVVISSISLVGAVILTLTYLIGKLSGENYLPGFPTVVISLMLNLAASSYILMMTTSTRAEVRNLGSRRLAQFQRLHIIGEANI